MRLHGGDFWRILRPNTFLNRRSPLRNRLSSIFLQVIEKCIEYQRICWLKQKLFRWNALYTGFHWETAFVREILKCTLTDLEQTIAFGVSSILSQISIDDQILEVSVATFRCKVTIEIEMGDWRLNHTPNAIGQTINSFLVTSIC